MPQDNFKWALKQAKRELTAAIDERSAVECRIVSLKQTISGLSALCGPEGEADVVEVGNGLPPGGYRTSLTNEVRRVLSDAGCILTPPQIRSTLVETMRVNLSKYKQPLVPIHNTLKRLESQHEVITVKDENGDLLGYRWVPPIARAMAELDASRSAQKLTRRVNLDDRK